MVYEKPAIFSKIQPSENPPVVAFAIAIVLAADVGTWIWATRRVDKATQSAETGARFISSKLSVITLPGIFNSSSLSPLALVNII
jgi:hypothetical protein